ncbi:MAG: transcription-repair coupling factor [Thermodesulfobacteriota bacterium]
MNRYSDTDCFSVVADLLRNRGGRVAVSGLGGAERALLIARQFRHRPQHLVVILATSREAEQFLLDLRFFLNDDHTPVHYFPPYNLLPYKMVSYHAETTADRIRVLFQTMESAKPWILVTTVGAVMRRLMPKQALLDFVELIMAGEEIDRDALVEKMISGGYVRSAIVEEPGDFCVRGAILDVFSPLYPDPLRIELFGDTVDSLRFFSPGNQRKLKDLGEAVILPARETILRQSDLKDFIIRVRTLAAEQQAASREVRGLIERIRNEGLFPGIESMLPLIYPGLDTLMDYMPADTGYVLVEPAGLEIAAVETYGLTESHYVGACQENRLCVPPQQLYLDWTGLAEALGRKPTLTLGLLPMGKATPSWIGQAADVQFRIEDNGEVRTALRNPVEKEHLLKPLADWIERQKESGNTVLLVCSTKPQMERLQSLLQPYDIRPRTADGLPEPGRSRGIVYCCIGRLSGGFVWTEAALSVITEDEIFGEKRRRRARSKQDVRAELLNIEDLKQEDLVVHSDHGIGRYQGLVKLEMNGAAGDFLLILYQDDDKLYLPVERMNMVRKYIGVDGIVPVLDKMGGKAWEKTKKKAKEEVEKIAGELLELYATRKAQQGHAFEKADSYFRDFEAGFVYDETPDQLKAIDDVLDDMESSTPMDRLVCGDVGYGKTEVALRASFKAVSDSKQVAVLVPTTVLAEQHYKTFQERFRRYPVRLACLNRFRSPRERKQIVEGLRQGVIDIVVGTHRLLQKDVAFKDLGLIIMDEEQRFGVKHKEKLKKLRATVDVLALTATPIPRTLHMSLMGIRDISVISTPPEQRHPIITYISEFDDGIVADAIRNELKRQGQVFFVHNNIHSIEKIAGHIRKLVPEARLAVAHGRLAEDELEKVMIRFIAREIDVLVCTTIVESGLDIPSANTILINRADRFGLAQIYQLRGRVGRAEEQAYAYLFIPKETILGKDAQKRLKVLMEHSDLGAGFQIAMSDLQIRGGGDALGVSQSGHIAAVGYDMFLQLLENAVMELKGKPVLEPLEPEINIALSAFIPEAYIPDIDQRLSAYRRLAKLTEIKEINAFKEELQDRFGALPEPATSLLLKIMMKILAKNGGIKRLDLVGQQLTLAFSAIHQKNPLGIVELVSTAPGRFQFTSDSGLKIRLPAGNPNQCLAETKNILKEIARRVNC